MQHEFFCSIAAIATQYNDDPNFQKNSPTWTKQFIHNGIDPEKLIQNPNNIIYDGTAPIVTDGDFTHVIGICENFKDCFKGGQARSLGTFSGQQFCAGVLLVQVTGQRKFNRALSSYDLAKVKVAKIHYDICSIYGLTDTNDIADPEEW